MYQPYISTSYQRPTDTHISTVYQADTAAGKLILVYQPNTRGSHPHRLVYQPHTGTWQIPRPPRQHQHPTPRVSASYRHLADSQPGRHTTLSCISLIEALSHSAFSLLTFEKRRWSGSNPGIASIKSNEMPIIPRREAIDMIGKIAASYGETISLRGENRAL